MDLSLPSAGRADHSFTNDRRTSPRHPYQRTTLCQPCPLLPSVSPKGGGNLADNVWLMGASQDLSATGVGFILHRRFDPGTLLTIELERPKRDSWGVLPARVMHVTPQADGNWKLGCALVNAMSQEELNGWINGSKAAAHR
jgi:PilZ domain